MPFPGDPPQAARSGHKWACTGGLWRYGTKLDHGFGQSEEHHEWSGGCVQRQRLVAAFPRSQPGAPGPAGHGARDHRQRSAGASVQRRARNVRWARCGTGQPPPRVLQASGRAGDGASPGRGAGGTDASSGWWWSSTTSPSSGVHNTVWNCCTGRRTGSAHRWIPTEPRRISQICWSPRWASSPRCTWSKPPSPVPKHPSWPGSEGISCKAGIYRPARSTAGVGGDWFDVELDPAPRSVSAACRSR